MRSLAPLLIVSVAACNGGSRPSNVHAFAAGASVEVSWDPMPGASAYRVQLIDFDAGAVGAQVSTFATHVVLPGTASGVRVEALPGESTLAAVTAGPSGGTGAAWQLFGPDDFANGQLRATFPSLGASERLGVLLVHSSGGDKAAATVQISGVADGAASGAEKVNGVNFPDTQVNAVNHSVDSVADIEKTPLGVAHDLVRAAQAKVALPASAAATEAAPADDHRAFCVVQGLDFSTHLRKPATRMLQTEHGDFFVDDDDLAHYTPAFFQQLGATYEANVWPADTTNFGMPTDVDANGRIIVLLTHELGAHLNGGWLIGYFGNADLLNARDDSSSCSGNGSNHGEIVYMNDVSNGAINGWSASDLSSTIYPETLAHEIQHLLNLGHRCVLKSCDGPQETWLNEGLSKVAEDLAGYGWNGSIGRGEGAQYLARASSGSLLGYDGRSLTVWEGDPIGNYQGAHSFVRFFADRLGAQVATQLALGNDVEATLNRPWPRAMAEWASALLLSNEQGAPFNYSGASWSPLHQRLRPLDTRTPGTATLRTDGIAAFVSGAGQGAPASVTVQADSNTWVAVVRTSAL